MIPEKPVLLTGASGTIGRLLSARLAALGWTLRLTDIVPLPIPLPDGASFTIADIEDQQAVNELAQGCGLILHFGGISTEQSFETVLGPNFRGTFHIYEAARRERGRAGRQTFLDRYTPLPATEPLVELYLRMVAG